MEDNYYRQQVAVPNSTIILILGIVSIVTCWCYGVIGLICAIVAVVLSGSASRQYRADPTAYTESSYKNVRKDLRHYRLGSFPFILALRHYVYCDCRFWHIERSGSIAGVVTELSTLIFPESLKQKRLPEIFRQPFL